MSFVFRNKPFDHTWLYVNAVNSRKPQGWRLVARRTNHVIRRLELSVPPRLPQLWGGRRGWRFCSVTKGEWFNQSCLCSDGSINIWNHGFGEFCVGQHVEVLGEWCSWRGHGSSCPTHLLSGCSWVISFPWATIIS